MRFDELLRSGRIRKERISRQEVERALERAERDLKAARKLLGVDWDWGFAITYNAVLQVSRAYMFARGFRPASAEGHKNTFAFMRAAMGKGHEETISYFDRMRNKRNRAVYDAAGMVTETEARSLFKAATAFVALIRKKLSAAG